MSLFLTPLLSYYNPIFVEYDHSAPETNAYWVAQQGVSFASILLSGNIIDGVWVDAVDGTNFTLNLERVLFHELAHGRLIKDERPTDLDTSFFLEQVAVFAENAFYHAQFGGGERVGHTDGSLSGKSVSAVAYLDGLKYTDAKVDGEKATFVFGDESDGIIKHYYRTSHVHQAATVQQYFNYVDATRLLGSGVIAAGAQPFDEVTLGILDSSIVKAPEAMIAAARVAVASLAAVTVPRELFPAGAAFDQALDQKALRVISAERFADAYQNGPFIDFVDAFGPVDHAIRGTPATFVLDGDDLNGTVLLGASGYHQGQIDTRGAVDDMRGTSGNDLLVAGIGGTALRPSRLDGAGGKDILIGQSGIEVLTGGNDSDLLAGGLGADVLDGGAGTDTVSYAASLEGVTINLGLRLTQGPDAVVGFGGDAQGDVIKNCEVIVGSKFDDVLIGDGSGVCLVGDAGNDTFHLYYNDVAVGGPGADKFYVSTNQLAPGQPAGGQSSIAYIIGLDPWDEIYVNGARYTGRTREMEMALNPHTGRYTVPVVTSDTSAYGPVYSPGESGYYYEGTADRFDHLFTGIATDREGNPIGLDPAGRGRIVFTDYRPESPELFVLFLQGYQPGDAGLHYSYDYWSNRSESIQNTDGADPFAEWHLTIDYPQELTTTDDGSAFSAELDWGIAYHQSELLSPLACIA